VFDYLNPDYSAVLVRRLNMLRKLRDDPTLVPVLKAYYRLNPWDFVRDWGMTYDPRNIERGLPATIPFIPFARQVEMMKWIHDHWRASKDGVVPKSRDTGASWVAIALSCTLCLFNEGMAIGFGSRKEEYVDKLDSPKSLFYKARVFLTNLPAEFRGGWTREKHGAFMRLTFPETGAVMTGEAGDNIGRGDRVAIFFVDESAHLERPQLAEEALSATTNCRIDLSSVKGAGTPFSVKRRTWPAEDVFTFHWRDDPRKTEAWYENLKRTKDPTVIAQEYDIDENAAVEGVVIPSQWVQAAIDAHIKLGIEPTGKRTGGLDVADEGKDLNAFAGRLGILLQSCEAWSGKESDIYGTTENAFDICDTHDIGSFRYDADGLGAGVRGDARVIQETRERQVEVTPFRGSAAVLDPDNKIPTIDNDPERDKEERTNKDYFQNAKAQAWWHLRLRFLRTYRAVVLGHPVTDPDELISISSGIPELTKLTTELSQPTFSENGAGKIQINKTPDGTRSPNYADAVMIAFAPSEPARRGFFDI
jgi:phage terminase large subunit